MGTLRLHRIIAGLGFRACLFFAAWGLGFRANASFLTLRIKGMGFMACGAEVQD